MSGRADIAAEQAARPARVRHPELANARMRRGLRLYSQGQLAEALDEFRTALQLDPEDFHARVCLANTLLDLHRADEALFAFRKAIQVSPADGRDLIRNLGYEMPGL